MKITKDVKIVKAVCCLLTITCIVNNTSFVAMDVNAMEVEANQEETQNTIAGFVEEEQTKTTEIVEERQSENENVEEVTEETTCSKEEMTEEETTEEETTEEESTEEEISASAKNDEVIESKHLCQEIDDCVIQVIGKMPQDAELVVKRENISQQIKKEISQISEIIEQPKDMQEDHIAAYSYDISILHDGIEYEPYLFDEMLEVRFQVRDYKNHEKLESMEVFHVGDTNKAVEEIEAKEEADNVIVFKADHFSQFIILTDTTYQDKNLWKYEYTKEKEMLKVPTKGIYEFRIYGAQGENSDSYEGGKGGFASGKLQLNKNDLLTLEVGGQDGYLEGGKGQSTNGGGATRLYLNGNLVAVAGGGAGALVNRDGGAGGTSNNKVQSSCGENSTVEYSAGGGAGYQGGQAGYVTYHNHTGDSEHEEGCYTKPIYHAHTQACFGIVCSHSNLIKDKVWYNGEGDDFSDWHCAECGKGFLSNVENLAPPTSPTYGWTCKSDGVIVGYDLNCGMTTETIVGGIPSYGGSNYVSDEVQDEILQNGVRKGSGYAEVELVELDCSKIQYENDGHVFKTFYVERGTEFNGQFLELPTKRTDEKYSYKFLGWDDMSTDVKEQYSTGETLAGKMNADRLYQAVYQLIPRQYVVTFENDETIPNGTKNVIATYNEKMQDIVVPEKTGFIFAGYYKDINDEGTKYYDAYGKAIRHSDFVDDVILYAKWEDPLTILSSPQDQEVTVGYSGVVLKTSTKLFPENGYVQKYQWYVNSDKTITGAKEIETGFSDKLLVPENYKVGKYYFFCKISVSGSVGQEIIKYTDFAEVQVAKTALNNENLIIENNQVTYDGKEHEIHVTVKNDPEAVVYYSDKKLDSNNYKTEGTCNPLAYKDAGLYQTYIYVVSKNYDDFSEVITTEIKKGKPTIYLASKNTTYIEDETQGIDMAKVYGADGQILEGVEIVYTYYTDEELRNKTTKDDGASVDGDKPSKIGTYYVSAKVAESKNYESIETVQCAMLNILGGMVPYSISDYRGIYDGKPHGLNICLHDQKRLEIYFSDTTELTKDNYKLEGTKERFEYIKPGKYEIFYVVSAKLTNELDSVFAGKAYIIIEQPQNHNSGSGNNGESGNGNQVDQVIGLNHPNITKKPSNSSDHVIDDEKMFDFLLFSKENEKNQSKKRNNKSLGKIFEDNKVIVNEKNEISNSDLFEEENANSMEEFRKDEEPVSFEAFDNTPKYADDMNNNQEKREIKFMIAGFILGIIFIGLFMLILTMAKKRQEEK